MDSAGEGGRGWHYGTLIDNVAYLLDFLEEKSRQKSVRCPKS